MRSSLLTRHAKALPRAYLLRTRAYATQPAEPQVPAALNDINFVSLAGRVKFQPNYFTFETSQSTKSTFVVDVPRRGGNSASNTIRVVAWNDLANHVTATVQEGAEVRVTGELQHNRWQDKKTQEWKEEVIVVADAVQVVAPGTLPQSLPPNPQTSSPQGPTSAYQSSPPGNSSDPQFEPLKPNRVWPKVASIYYEWKENPYACFQIAQKHGVKPYTALTYAFTYWEVQNEPTDLGLMAVLLDLGAPGSADFLSPEAIMEVIDQIYTESNQNVQVVELKPGIVRSRLLAQYGDIIDRTEADRGGAGVTWAQIKFVEALYRRGVNPSEISSAAEAIRSTQE